MTILSAQSIRARTGMITPFSEKSRINGMSYGLGSASYDVTCAESCSIPPLGIGWVSTIEKFDIPNDLIARVSPKSTWARQGVVTPNTYYDPGFKGHGTVLLINHSNDRITISRGMPIAQFAFELLDQPTEAPYAGLYQNAGPGVQEAIIANDDAPPPPMPAPTPPPYSISAADAGITLTPVLTADLVVAGVIDEPSPKAIDPNAGGNPAEEPAATDTQAETATP